MSKTIIAIDFGTCNSYVSYVEDTEGHIGIPRPLMLSDTHESLEGIQTAVLYFIEGKHKGTINYGQDAFDKFLPESPERRNEMMRLAMDFKPDICIRPEAKEDAINFLKYLREEANKHFTGIDNAQVIIGVPSEANRVNTDVHKRDFCNTLKEIAKKAGWGEVRLLDEPFGPLFSLHDSKSIHEIRDELLNKNYLVVDFGGGTCDFAVLKDGKLVVPSWGDMCLGGRLFDDLFYQWMLDLSDNTDYSEEKHMKDGLDGYYRDYKCREIKEKFSRYMERNHMEGEWVKDIYEICHSKRLSLTWNEFENRAKRYKPSISFRKTYGALLNVDISTTEFKVDQEVNLFEWFERVLRSGLRKNNIGIETIDNVVLAGGSSYWPFVSKICINIFSEPKVKKCPNFFEAIANGLAKYALVKEQTKDAMRKLEVSKDALINNLSSDAVAKLQINKNSKILKDLGGNIFDDLAVPTLKRFAEQGGKMIDLENQMKLFIEKNHDKMERCLSNALKEAILKLNMNISEKIRKWFNDNGVPNSDYKCQDVELPIFEMTKTGVHPFTFVMKSLEYGLGAIISSVLSAAIIGLLYALVTAVFGTAIVIQPRLWPWYIVTAVVIVIVIFVVTGSVKIKGAVEKKTLSSTITSWLINDKRIGKMRIRFIKKFSKMFPETYNKMINDQAANIRKAIEDMVENELKRYNKILEMENR